MLQQFFAICDAIFGRVTTLVERAAIAAAWLSTLDDGQLLEAVPNVPRVGPAPPAGQRDDRDVDRAAMTDVQKAAAGVWAYQNITRTTWRAYNKRNKVAAANASADADPPPL